MYINDKYRVTWRHDVENKTTECSIQIEDDLIAFGQSKVRDHQSFSKIIGRRASLTKALSEEGGWDSTKAERAQIWDGVRQQAHLSITQKTNERNERRIINEVLDTLHANGLLQDLHDYELNEEAS